jgi:Glycosyl hydrolases family 28
MKIKTTILTLVIFIAANLFCQTKEYKLTDFGAKADGITNNAKAIQKAIDFASSNGGGKVVIPPGNFASGVIFMKSNVDLHLDLGARLLGSVDKNDYDNPIALALIVAKDQKNISLSGKGIIDGQAGELIKNIFKMLDTGTLTDKGWKTKRPNESNRPMLIDFINCNNVKVTNITLMNPAGWLENYNKCRNLIIDSITVQSTAYWNNDGIDITDCKNVKVTNCNVNAADDGICLKSEDPNDFCDSINIAHCVIRSSASAFKMGTASSGGFKNVVVRDLTIYDTYRSAIAIESVDGGILENIDIRNITAKNTGNAIFIRLGHRNKEGKVGELKNVHISNVKAEIPLRKPDLGYPLEGPPDYLRYSAQRKEKKRPDLGYPYTGLPKWPYNLIPSSIVGIPGHYVKNITLENIEIVFEGASSKELAHIQLDYLNKVPEMESDYPEFSMFGELPAWGFYIRHASGIHMKNVKLSYKEFDFRPALVFDDAKDIHLNEVDITTGKELPIILFNNAENISTSNLKLPVSSDKAIKRQ